MILEPINLESTTEMMNCRPGQMFQVTADGQSFKSPMYYDEARNTKYFINQKTGKRHVPFLVTELLRINVLR